MRGLAITGTDTGVGKTTVAAGIVACLRQAGWAVSVSKPVATGDDWDTRTLLVAAGLPIEERERVTPWQFAEPLAPAVAARRAGVTLRLADLAAAVRRQARPEGVLIVEGAGGLLCPLAEDGSVADLFVELGLPVVIVARRSLGTLNHTLLTVEAAQRRGLTVAGVVVSEVTPPITLADASNVEELGRLLPATVPVLAVVEHGSTAGRGADLAAVDWWERAGRELSGRRPDNVGPTTRVS